MKLVKFFAAMIAAASMFVACEATEENKQNGGNDVIVQEYVNVYCDITATGWEKCGVWAWNLSNTSENYTGGTWPGQELTATETIDGVEYYIWECPKELVGTEIGFIVNEFVDGGAQTVDINLPVADGVKVAVNPNDEGGFVITINGEEFVPEEKPEATLEDFVFADHTYGLIGSFNDWSADVAMEIIEGWATATVELPADAQFKVRVDGGWDYSFGYDVTEDAPLAPVNGTEFVTSFNGQDNNITVVEAATYKVEFQVAVVEEANVGKMKITKLAE